MTERKKDREKETRQLISELKSEFKQIEQILKDSKFKERLAKKKV